MSLRSLDGSRAGPRGLDDEGWKLMGSVSHGGYLPSVTQSRLHELTVDGARYRCFWVTSSDTIGSFDLSHELERLSWTRGAELPERDLVAEWLPEPR